MALVEIARFTDITEVQAAAAGLRASGIPVLVMNEHWGQSQFYMLLAIGGFGLWAPEQDAEAAAEFINAHRTNDPAALQWTRHPAVLTGGPMALLWALFFPMGGWAYAALRRGLTPARVAVFAGSLALLGVFMALGLTSVLAAAR